MTGKAAAQGGRQDFQMKIDLSASSGSGNAGWNATRKDVLTTWVLGVTSVLKSLGDISANEDWRILATHHQHRSLSNSAKMAGNIWKQFESTTDRTFPSTSTLIEETLEKVSAGGNLPAGKLTLPAFKRMQDFVPADGKEVFIITDSVTLLGKNGKCKTRTIHIFTNICGLYLVSTLRS